MEQCYEYFRCHKKECPLFKMPRSTKCWEIDGTLCHHEESQNIIIKYNKDKCHYCQYYKAMLDFT